MSSSILARTLKSWYVFGLQLPFLPEWVLGRDDFKLMRRFIRWDGEVGPMTASDERLYREAWTRDDATPVTYRLRPEGRQYVVIAAGGHVFSKEQVVAFALPATEPES